MWAAGAVSLAGDWLSFVAVSALALASGGGAIGLALVFAAHALPAAVLAPVAGALVDRFDRRRVLVAADTLAAIITAAMAGAAVMGWIGAVQVLLLARSAISALVPPGESAALRRVVEPGELVRANAILAATWSVAFVAGMSLGGAAALLGPALALAIDSLSFVIAAALHATLPPMPPATEPVSIAAVVRATPRDTAIALRVAAGHRQLFEAVLGKAPLALAGGAAWIALNLIGAEEEPFGAAALSFGVLQAVRGAGTGIGPAVAARLARGGVADESLQWGARVAMIGAIVSLALARSPAALVAVTLVWGIGSGTNWVLSHSALQRHSPDEVIGRLAAFDELLVTLAMVIGVFAGAGAVLASGNSAAALVAGALGACGIAAAAVIARLVSGPRPASLLERQAADQVHLAQRDPVVAQDVVGGGEVKVKVG